MAERKATVKRDTLETKIQVSLNLDGNGKSKLDTGVAFLEHMLDQVARHGMFDLDVLAKGDVESWRAIDHSASTSRYWPRCVR